MLAVGLVDRDHVGDLEDALLDALQLVAGARQGQEQEGVDHAGDRDLGLADADGLDQHHVVAGGLEHDHRLGGGAGDAAEGAGGRRGPDVGVRVGGELRHPGLVAEHRAAGAHAGRVDREHADPLTARGEVLPSVSMKVDLPTPGTPEMPTRTASLRVAARRVSSSAAPRAPA